MPHHPPHPLRSRSVATALLTGLVLAGLAGCAARAGRPALPAEAVQRLVDPRASGGPLDWLGGDVASSARLSPQRYVWIFGDTLLGQARRDCPKGITYCGRDLADDPERAMIANSVALMPIEHGGRPGPLQPFWRTIDGHPEPIFAAARPDEFLWPLAVVRVGQPLFVAASVHTRAMGLFSLGSTLVVVHDPDDSPAHWRYTAHPVPNTILAGPHQPQLSWATALVPLGPHVYLVGEYGSGPGSHTVLARFSADGANDPAWHPALEYLTTDGARAVWRRTFDETRLARVPGLPGTSEATFDRGGDGSWRTYRIPPGTFEIRRYDATALEGPWTDAGVIARIPAPWSTALRPDGSSRYAAYAVKAHPELGTTDHPVLTYNVNVTDGSFSSAVQEAEQRPDFYVPRAVTAP